MSSLNHGGLAGLGRGALRESDHQYDALLRDLVGAVERNGALTDELRRQAAAHARDIASMRQDFVRSERNATERFQAVLANHKGGGLYRGRFQSEHSARVFGRAVIAIMQRDQAGLSGALSEMQALDTAAMLPTSGPAGGYLMPDVLVRDLIRNVEEAGVFESNCPAFPVDALKGGVPSRTGGVTVYYPDFGVAGTPSTPTLGKKNFDLKRYIAGVEIEDWMLASQNAVPLAEYVADELAYALALAGDTNWFIGDGTGSYCGQTGLFKSGMANMTDLGLQVVTGDSGDDTIAEMVAKSTYYLAAMMGKLPLWAHRSEPKWYGHLATFFQYLGVRDTTGQPIVANVIATPDKPGLYLMGYPFVPVQVAPSATAVSTVFMLLASLKRSARVFRHNAGVRFRTGEQVKFWEELTVFAASAAQDMVVTDGNGIVQLKTAAS
jgi:HK97 family phage major capsid protein